MKYFILLSIFGFFNCVLTQNPCMELDAALGGTGFVNDYAECESYFSCNSFVPTRQNCPDGFMIFTDTAGVQSCSASSETVEPICKPCPDSVTKLPIPWDDSKCRKYVFCNEFKDGLVGTTVHECEEGTRFDPAYRLCNLEANVPCEPPAYGECPADGSSGFFPALQCSQFLNCPDSDTLYECPTGMYFDTSMDPMNCNIASKVTCGTRTV